MKTVYFAFWAFDPPGSIQCTTQLSPRKMVNQEFEQNFHHIPHFFPVQLFQIKFLGEYFVNILQWEYMSDKYISLKEKEKNIILYSISMMRHICLTLKRLPDAE